MRRCSRGPDLGTRENFLEEVTFEVSSEHGEGAGELRRPMWEGGAEGPTEMRGRVGQGQGSSGHIMKL